MKKILLIILLVIFIPIVKADSLIDEEDLVIVSEETKYYKTTYFKQTYDIMLNSMYENSKTVEISQEEFESSNNIIPNLVGVETIYNKLTSQIIQNGSYYRYKAILTWKNIPKTRSYDIIGIGYNSNVKIIGSPVFQMNYCLDGYCKTTSSHSPQTFSNGVGTSFLLPSGNLTSLSSTFYFNVTKKVDSVTSQFAAADYSHASSNISKDKSRNYSVGGSGIVLNGIGNYYDSMNTATAYWSGNW